MRNSRNYVLCLGLSLVCQGAAFANKGGIKGTGVARPPVAQNGVSAPRAGISAPGLLHQNGQEVKGHQGGPAVGTGMDQEAVKEASHVDGNRLDSASLGLDSGATAEIAAAKDALAEANVGPDEMEIQTLAIESVDEVSTDWVEVKGSAAAYANAVKEGALASQNSSLKVELASSLNSATNGKYAACKEGDPAASSVVALAQAL